MRRLYAVPLGVVGLCLVTALELLPSLRSVRADPSAIVVTYLAFSLDVAGGAWSALLLGAVLDVMSGAPMGLHALSLGVLFVVLRVLANAVQLKPGLSLVPVAMGAGWFHAALVTLMVSIFGEGHLRWVGFLQSSLPSLVADALLAVLLLPLCGRLAARFSPDQDRMFA